MKTIRFSHKYYKLQDNSGRNIPATAILVSVIQTSLVSLPYEFVNYDTEYSGGFYPLKQGQYVMLLFLSHYTEKRPLLFTTIRPYNPDKLSYYTNAIGETFKVEVK